MGRSPCCSKEGLNRGAWTADEDKILIEYIREHGEGRWRNLPKRAGLNRCGKSCRLRWLNYLRPDIKRGNISSDEEDLIIRLHNLLGNRWSLIAGRLPGRTDNEIKNYWNTNLGKKVKDRQQITPTTNAKPQVVTPNVKVTPNPKLDTTRVVRTKASKVLFNNSSSSSSSSSLPHSSSMQLQINKSKAEDAVSNNSISNRSMEPSHNNNGLFLSFINDEDEEEEEKELISTDLLKDYKAGDICLSQVFLNSDLSNIMCDFSYKNEDLLSPCSDQFPVFSEEILKDWTQTNFASETKVQP